MEDDLQTNNATKQKLKLKNNNIFENGRHLNLFEKGIRPIFFENRRQPQKKMQPKQLKVKTMVVAPLRVT